MRGDKKTIRIFWTLFAFNALFYIPGATFGAYIGAGDVFHGAYIVGLLEGMNAPECARFASAVSAIKCTCFGGRTGIPDRKTVAEFLETGVIDDTQAQERLAYYRNNL